MVKNTEQDRVKSQSSASEELFRTLIEKTPVAMAINRNGLTLFANQAYVTMFGYDGNSELLGTLVTNQVAPGSRRAIGNKIKSREKGETLPGEHETVGLRKDGATFPLFVQVNNIVLPDGPANVAFFTDITARKQAAELVIANKELAFQSGEKADRAAELVIANKELVFQSGEKADRAAELVIANKELVFQSGEKADRAAELVIANKELVFQSGEKADRAAELVIANKELVFQSGEKADRAAELIIANKELAFQNQEKDKRAAELIIANKELAFQNAEKDKRAAELQRIHLLLKSSLESPKDIIILSIDKNYNYYYFNKAHQDAMKSAYDKDVAIGMNLLEAITSETDRVIAKYNIDLALKGESQSAIQKYGTKAISYQETFYNPIINESDEIIGATVFARDVTERQRTEAARLRQVDAQAHLLEISKNFTNIVVDDIDDVIYTTLRMIGEYGHDEHSCICLFSEDQSTTSNTHEWWAEGVAAGMDSAQEFPASSFPWWNEKIQSSEFIHIPRVADLPPEAQADKEFLQAHSIQSLLAVPMCLEDKITGFLGVASVRSAKTWSEDNISMLESVAQIISKALLRKKNYQALRDSESYYRTIFENTGAATLIIEEDMTISLANQGCENMFGYKKGILEGTQWTEIASEDMLDTMEEYHRLRRIDPASAPKLYISRIKDYNGKLRDGLVCADVIPGTNKSVATFIDLTDYKRIERALKAICAGNSVMIHSENEQDLLDGICRKIVQAGAYSLAWVGYLQEDQQKKVKPVAHDGKNNGYLNKLNIALKDPKRGQGPVARAIRNGQPVVSRDIKKDDTFEPWVKDALRRGFKSCMSIPLMVGDKAFGAMSIYANETDAFDNEEQIMLIEMVNNLAYAIMSRRARIENNQNAEDLRLSLEKMQRILMQSVTSLGNTLEIRDPYTAGHQIRVTKVAVAIAREMRLPQEQIEGIVVAGNLHDIGKITVPSEILNKPGKLSDLELAIINTHPQTGYEIVKDIEFSLPVAEIVLQHHERMNGSGYPQGLAGDEILMEARIMAVADVVEAMASHRLYRPALGIDVALEEIEQNKGILYDADVAEACLKLFRRKGFKLE